MIGFFIQDRIGYKGNKFKLIKIRTYNREEQITRFGHICRNTKLDELPQLFNVFIGDMSFVGPRPDLEGFADQLKGDDRIILDVKPGLTGPATIKYMRESRIISASKMTIPSIEQQLWQDKVHINKEYVENRNFLLDLKYIFKTFVLLFKN